MKKKYLVFGAGGSIGSAIARRLLNDGLEVVACMRFKPENLVQEALSASGASIRFVEDVSDPRCLDAFIRAHATEMYDGVIYSVGHCPPSGFPDVIKHPLSTLPLATLDSEYLMHQRGVVNTFQKFLPAVVSGGCFFFMSSAITRFTDDRWPIPGKALQFHYHCAAIAAEDWLIRSMNFDPVVRSREIKIHWIAPGAVDTPFHQGGPKPPGMLSLEFIAERVTVALASSKNVGETILEPPASGV